MKKYKVTLWKRTDYCDVASSDEENCTYSVLIQADNKYQAATQALSPYSPDYPDVKPIIYEIKELL